MSLHQPLQEGRRRQPASLGCLVTGLSPATSYMSSHFAGVENAFPSFQLWVGTVAKYLQNKVLGKSFYKIE